MPVDDLACLLQTAHILVAPGGEVENLLAPGPLQSSDSTYLAQRASAKPSRQAFDYVVTFATPKGVIPQRYRFTTLVLPASALDRAARPMVVVGEINGVEGALFNLALTIGITGTLLLLCSTLSGFWLANRAMQPVRTITRLAQQLSETDLSRRLHLTQRDELGELGQTFDQMLERLELAFERQRQIAIARAGSKDVRGVLFTLRQSSCRKGDRKGGACSAFAVHRDGSSMVLHDLSHDVEPHAQARDRSLFGISGPIEALNSPKVLLCCRKEHSS